MIEPVPLATAPNRVMGQQNLKLKNRMKIGNSDVPRFQYCSFLTENISLILYQSNKHLQHTLLIKLIDQFHELHNTQFIKRLQNLT